MESPVSVVNKKRIDNTCIQFWKKNHWELQIHNQGPVEVSVNLLEERVCYGE